MIIFASDDDNSRPFNSHFTVGVGFPLISTRNSAVSFSLIDNEFGPVTEQFQTVMQNYKTKIIKSIINRIISQANQKNSNKRYNEVRDKALPKIEQ